MRETLYDSIREQREESTKMSYRVVLAGYLKESSNL